MAKWIQTKYEGVRYREHPTRKFGVRKDRYYAIRYYFDDPEDGKRKRREEQLGWETVWKASHPEGTISLEQEAVARRAKLLKNQKEGTGPTSLKEERSENKAAREAKATKAKQDAEAQKTLSDYWDKTYFPAAKRSKKESSWIKEQQHFKLWIKPLLGELTLGSIGLKQWDELVKSLAIGRIVQRKGGVPITVIPSQRSKEYITGTLRRILKHAYDRRMVDEAPPTGKRIGVSGPGNNRRLRIISSEEETAILEHLAITDLHAWRLAKFAFLTGCRVSEGFNLKWGNVDHLSQMTITFPETKNRDPRTIPITPPLMELFDSIQQGSPDTHVFTKEDGSAYLQAPYSFATVVKNLGLNEGRSERDQITFHSIRHTVATRLAQRLGPRDLMDIMGWRTVQMAMRYVHANQDAKMKALSMLGAAPAKGKVLPFRAEAAQEK